MRTTLDVSLVALLLWVVSLIWAEHDCHTMGGDPAGFYRGLYRCELDGE